VLEAPVYSHHACIAHRHARLLGSLVHHSDRGPTESWADILKGLLPAGRQLGASRTLHRTRPRHILAADSVWRWSTMFRCRDRILESGLCQLL
jgi:hypothetical protein